MNTSLWSNKWIHQIVAAGFVLIVAVSAFAQGHDATAPGVALNMAQMKFATVPGLPTCTQGSVQMGDPSKGPSIILAKMKKGCIIPWHWHTPAEHLMIVSGVASAQMKGEKPVTLKAGGFAIMPSHHIHQFHAIEDCVFYIYSDAAFDIHYVDEQEKEIAPDAALKAVKETVAMGMK
jgi:quercetin dioxygenase-like cupin family protein